MELPLKDKTKKQEIFSAIINDSALSKEFMDAMMKNPQRCKMMMKNDGMKKMMMDDSGMMSENTKMKKMMEENTMMKNMMMKNMMDMAEMDTSMSKSMMQMMKGMNSMDTSSSGSVTYTCAMHPEITSATPGKCSKCGMDLVKKPMDKDKMKMP